MKSKTLALSILALGICLTQSGCVTAYILWSAMKANQRPAVTEVEPATNPTPDTP